MHGRLAPRRRLTDFPRFAAHDRVLVAAPHPDDEALATGGALQAAGAAGAARRVLVVTDGDDNPWPQRWTEKRWRIGDDDRARWGARRRAEALAALQVLGVAPDDVRCCGLPDLGLTEALMRGQPDVVALLLRELEAFRPTRLFLPALGDRHPDHSALHILLRLALRRYAGAPPQLHAFGVHGAAEAGENLSVLALTPAQRATKRAAIEQHATQMQLSRRRFVAYARDREVFRSVAAAPAPFADSPVHAAFAPDGRFTIAVDQAGWRTRLPAMIASVVLLGEAARPMRFRIPLSGPHAVLEDSATFEALGHAAIARSGSGVTIEARLPLRSASGWVKFGRRTPGLLVFDRFGWQPVARGGA